MGSEFPRRLSISSQPLSSRASGPLTARSSMIPALMRSAAGGDEAGEAAVGGSARWRWRPTASARWQESSTALPTGGMTPAPQSVLPRLPQRHRLGPGRGGGPLRQGRPPSPAPPPRGADHRKGGGGGSEGNGAGGGEERGAVNKELPLCEVLRWVQNSRLPEGPRSVRQPTREPTGSGTRSRAPGPTCRADDLPLRNKEARAH